MLKSSEARSIAHALWGKVNNTEKTNVKGAYWFNCEGHGGFIVAAEAIEENNRVWVENYIKKESAIRYVARSGKSVLMHGYRTRSARLAYYMTENVEFYIFEEDCAWAIAALVGISFKKPHKSQEEYIKEARSIFWSWYDKENPVVANRKLVEEKWKNGDPDLIISACGSWKTGIEGVTQVTTADRKVHLVRGYNKARDEYGDSYLSLCEAA